MASKKVKINLKLTVHGWEELMEAFNQDDGDCLIWLEDLIKQTLEDENVTTRSIDSSYEGDENE